MAPGRGCALTASKVPARIATLLLRIAPLSFNAASSSAESAEACQSPALSPDFSSSFAEQGGASLLQQRHQRSHTAYFVDDVQEAESSTARVFSDSVDDDCTPGRSCTAGDIPKSRGACVKIPDEEMERSNECWDICNSDHPPEDYTTGDAELERKIALAVRNVRAGKYPHMRCPISGASLLQKSEATTSRRHMLNSKDMANVMDDVKAAEEAAKKAVLLSSAARRESVALGNPDESEAAAVLSMAVAAEQNAAELASRTLKDLKEISGRQKPDPADDTAKPENEPENEVPPVDASPSSDEDSSASSNEPDAANGANEDSAVSASVDAPNTDSLPTDTATKEPEDEAEEAINTALNSTSSQELDKTLEELQKNIDVSLSEARRHAKIEEDLVRSKLAVKKDAEAKAVKVKEEYDKASEDGNDELLTVTKSSLEKDAAKAATELKVSLLNATEARLAVSRGVEQKEYIELKKLEERQRQLVSEIETDSDAIRQAMGLSTASEKGIGAVRKTIDGLTSSKALHVKEKAEQDKAVELKSASLAYAKEQTAKSEESVEDARKDVELAQEAEQEAENTLEEASKANLTSSVAAGEILDKANISDSVNAAGSIKQAGDEKKLEGWGRGTSKTTVAADSPTTATRKCDWKPQPECIADFKYQGKTYERCYDEVMAGTKAWCSMDQVYIGRWKECTFECEG